jgi:hypothetical protein
MINNPIITPIISPVQPVNLFPVENIPATIVLKVIAAFLVVGLALFLGWTLHRILTSKKMVTNLPLSLILSGVAGLGLFLRFGFSVTMLQGLFLFFVLLYASCSDLTDHTMDDFLWVMVAMLGLCSICTVGLPSMLIGAGIVIVPQIAFAMFPPHRTLGGADIKLSTAIAFLLGAWRGIGAYLLGLTLAVIVVSICNRKQNRCPPKPFALVPFLSIGAMIAFFI